MRTSVLLLAASLITGCASSRLEPMTQPNVPLVITNGGAADFHLSRAVCLFASDTESGDSPKQAILAQLAARGVAVQACHGGGAFDIVIQYSSGPSSCTPCPPPGLGRRFASAYVQVRSETAIRATADWTNTGGGTDEAMARAFADALAALMLQGGGGA